MKDHRMGQLRRNSATDTISSLSLSEGLTDLFDSREQVLSWLVLLDAVEDVFMPHRLASSLCSFLLLCMSCIQQSISLVSVWIVSTGEYWFSLSSLLCIEQIHLELLLSLSVEDTCVFVTLGHLFTVSVEMGSSISGMVALSPICRLLKVSLRIWPETLISRWTYVMAGSQAKWQNNSNDCDYLVWQTGSLGQCSDNRLETLSHISQVTPFFSTSSFFQAFQLPILNANDVYFSWQ